MIRVTHENDALDRTLLDQSGGFAWWYADIMNPWGDGLVLIWSFGLPFLPGYASAARRGSGQLPRERPSLNIALYRGGELDFYLLQEYDADDVVWDREGDRWRFGRSEMHLTRNGSSRARLEAEIDAEVPGTEDRLRGEIELEGSLSLAEAAAEESDDGEPFEAAGPDRDAAASHDWSPRIVPAEGRAHLRCTEDAYAMEGRAYHDCNGGAEPFHELGIDRWVWGRVPRSDSELVYYALWPEGSESDDPTCFAFRLFEDGRIERAASLTFDQAGRRHSPAGLTWFERLSLQGREGFEATIRRRSIIDNGPFYMRFVTESDGPGGEGVGTGELIRPGRIDLARHRPLVRMRVHHEQGDNSMWLPLFSGPRKGRVGRLFRHAGREIFG